MKGYHLLVDVYNADFNLLNNYDYIYDFLNALPDKINMTKISSPNLIYYDGNGKIDEPGYTGVVFIAESHISIHTFPYRNYATIDVYSCKEFDYLLIVEYIKEYFKTEDVDVQYTIRGLGFMYYNKYRRM